MKIEETPFQFNGVAGLDARRAARPPQEFSLEDFDLSFLELLNTLPGAPAPAEKAEDSKAPAAAQKPKAEAQGDPAKIKGHLRLVDSPTTPPPEETPEAVEEALTLLRHDLSDLDVQYLKQVVIPGLPIVMGSVPFQSVFPTAEDGQISYRGFEVSSKLDELIREGYKTGRPIRVELDKATAVVLKIRNGQVSAEFMSTDKTVALYMKQELDDLRHRMAMRNLPVGTLEYRDPRQPRRQSQQSASSADDEQA